MNTDYGFFHLFRALRSLRDNETEPALSEVRSTVEEKLPQINYSLLMSRPAHLQRRQLNPFCWVCFDFRLAATSQCPE
jgi:hypothetical protein